MSIIFEFDSEFLSMKKLKRFISILTITFALGGFGFAQTEVRFREQLDAFRKTDKENPPPKGAILFIGSSIFRKWTNLTEQMSPLPVFNRAFGGSRTNEVLAQFDEFVLPYQPKIVVYYCGSNDINADAKPGEIFARIKEFSKKVQEKLPKTKIYFVSINKAPQKMDRWNLVDETNLLAKNYFSKTKNREFIDVNPLLFDKGGKARAELYLEDKLHFKDEAYVEFTKQIKPILEKAWEKERKQFCKQNPLKCGEIK